MEKERLSQCKKIVGFMRLHGSITQWDAIRRFKCTRLSGRIFDLKKAGYQIDKKDEVSKGRRFTRYKLIGDPGTHR
jgi:hypothetical protein